MAVPTVYLMLITLDDGSEYCLFDVNNTRGWQWVMLVYLMLITLEDGSE